MPTITARGTGEINADAAEVAAEAVRRFAEEALGIMVRD
jgi:hypothetical protein